MNPEPGRFLITGSVDLVRGRYAPDSLAGRTETVTLLPLSQSELDGLNPSTFLNHAFESQFSNDDFIGISDDTIGRILRGGYPIAANRDSQRRRKEWLSNYVNSLMTRDVPDFTGILKSNALRQLVAHLATNSAQPINLSRLASEISVDGKSIDRWLTTLEDMILISRLPAWHRSDAKSLVKAPKLHFLDTGLLCALRNIDEQNLGSNRQLLGFILETFVYTELQKMCVRSNDSIMISHYRARSGVVVDLVLERSDGMTVGIEVKSSATNHYRDFRGLRQLESVIGEKFACGIVLNDSDRVRRADEKMFSMPYKVLWESQT